MKPRLTFERGTGNFLTIRGTAELWELYPDTGTGTGMYVFNHRNRNGLWTKELVAKENIPGILVDVITKNLGLSEFWNGQSDLFQSNQR